MVAPTLLRDETIEVSEKDGLVIPRSVLERLGIQPGQKLQLLVYKGQIVLMPEVHPRDVRGSMPDLDTSPEDEPDRV
jgi:bifunctional DNA-binding transcriptional regulator/antitoxin component of YhaV-PrlF toxin-antitoxin module